MSALTGLKRYIQCLVQLIFLNDLNLFLNHDFRGLHHSYLFVSLVVGWTVLLPKLTRVVFLCIFVNRLWSPNVSTYSARHASRGTLRFATGNVLAVEPHSDKTMLGRWRYETSPKWQWQTDLCVNSSDKLPCEYRLLSWRTSRSKLPK